jgi:hypothetical protein
MEPARTFESLFGLCGGLAVLLRLFKAQLQVIVFQDLDAREHLVQIIVAHDLQMFEMHFIIRMSMFWRQAGRVSGRLLRSDIKLSTFA